MNLLKQAKNKLIFISGGVRSGKSDFAEKLAIRYAQETGERPTYMATSKVEDEEMQARIERHRQQRQTSDIPWETIEIAHQFPENITQLPKQGIVLLDCLTVLLANELFAKLVTEAEIDQHSAQVTTDLMHSIDDLSQKTDCLLIVSNEIHHEIIDDIYVAAYQRSLGQLHQQIVAKSAQAYLVEAGIARLMK